MHLRRLTFELSGSQRQGARPGLRRMYLTAARAWRLAVGAPLDEGLGPTRRLESKFKVFSQFLVPDIRERSQFEVATALT